jgi:hypothetical protein
VLDLFIKKASSLETALRALENKNSLVIKLISWPDDLRKK